MTEDQINQLELNGSVTPEQAQKMRANVFPAAPAMSPDVLMTAPTITPPPSIDPMASANLASGSELDALATKLKAEQNGEFTGPPMSASNPGVTNTDSAAPNAPVAAPTIQAPSFSGPAYGTETTSKTTQNQYDKKDEKAFDASVDKLIEANDAETDAQLAVNKEKALGAEIKATEYQKYLDTEAAKQAEQQALVDQKYQEYQDEMAKYQNEKLDSGRFFGDGVTGTKVMAGLAVALGAMGQANGLAENPAVAIIDKAVERDIATQKFNIEQAGKRVDGKRTLYTDLVKKFGDERLARAAYQEVVFNKLAQETEAKVLKSNSEVLKANGTKAAAEFRNKADAAALERHKMTVENIKQTAPLKTTAPASPMSIWDKGEGDSLTANQQMIEAANELEKLYSDPTYADSVGIWDGNVEKLRGKIGLEQSQKFVELQRKSEELKKRIQLAETGLGMNLAEMRSLEENTSGTRQNAKNAAQLARTIAASAQSKMQVQKQAIAARYQNDPRVIEGLRTFGNSSAAPGYAKQK